MGKESSPSHLPPVFESFTDLPKSLRSAIKGAAGNDYQRIRNMGFDFTATTDAAGGSWSDVHIRTSSPEMAGDPDAGQWHHVNGLNDPERRVEILRGRHPEATDPLLDFVHRKAPTHAEGPGKHRSKVKARGNADLQKYIAGNRRT